MATSNSVTNNFRSGYSLRLDWTEYDINVANNTSSLAIAIHLISGGSSYYINSSATKYIHENIAGFQGDKTFSASLKGGEDKIIYWNFIENIQHSSDGSSSFWIGFDVGLNVTLSGVYYGTISISDTVNLTKIARKSTLSVGNATIGSAHSMTIQRQDASFTHSISYYFGNASGTIPVNGTTASWTPPASLAAQIPASTSGACRLVLTTYVGGSSIGSNEYWITLSVPSQMVPTVSKPVITDVSGSTKGWLRNYSRAKWSVSAAGVQGSTITSCQLIFSNINNSGGSATYSGTTGTASAFDRVGAVSVVAKVTDSRGRTAQSAAVSITYKDYRIPEITEAKLMRCEADGTENMAGEYCKVTVAGSIASTSGLIAKYTLRYKKTSQTSYPQDQNELADFAGETSISTSVIFAADGASPYDVEFVVEDGVTSVSRVLTLSTAEVLMHFGSNGSSMAIGKIVELDERTLDVNWDTLFRNKVELKDSLTAAGLGSFAGGIKSSGSVKISHNGRIIDVDTGTDGTAGIWDSDRKEWILANSKDGSRTTLKGMVKAGTGLETPGYIQANNYIVSDSFIRARGKIGTGDLTAHIKWHLGSSVVTVGIYGLCELFDTSTLNSWFGVSNCNMANTMILVANADNDANGGGTYGAVFTQNSGSKWFALHSGTIGSPARINWIAIYFG